MQSRALIAASILCIARAACAGDSEQVATYPATYFAPMHPYSAFDMLVATPGFALVESDPDVRGFAGAAGNVLIDGARPASKHESLEAALRRIPAAVVERIELIRSGASGVEMHGHSVLANVVRARISQQDGAVELASTRYESFTAPRAAAEWARETQEQRMELSGAAWEEAGDEHGVGVQDRATEQGVVLEHARYSRDERERTLELAAALERRLAKGLLRANGAYARERASVDSLETQVFPGEEVASDREQERQRDGEFGAHYEQAFGTGFQMEWLGLYRDSSETEQEESVAGAEASSFRQSTDASESILRGRILRTLARGTWEAGAEAARNVLEGNSTLEEDGVEVALPSAHVRVEEGRIEAFALASFRADARWTIEGGARFEHSVLEQTGDSNVRKTFFFPKPRLQLSYAAHDGGQWRVLIERRVGQLDFEDFVSSTSLSNDTLSAGNPDLEPERTSIVELAWERRWRAETSLQLTARREWISDLIDRKPIAAANGEVLDGVGNIGEGVRDELEIDFALPLSALGLEAARVKASALWRKGRATDPTTGARRAISEDLPFEGAVRFTHDLTAARIHWGVDVKFAVQAPEFMVDEIREERYGTRLDVFAEYTPAPAWRLRFAANNLTDRKFERERQIWEDPRGAAPPEYIETRTLRMGPFFTLSVRRSFGR